MHFLVIRTMATIMRAIGPIPMIHPKLHIGHMPQRICATTLSISSTSCHSATWMRERQHQFPRCWRCDCGNCSRRLQRNDLRTKPGQEGSALQRRRRSSGAIRRRMHQTRDKLVRKATSTAANSLTASATVMRLNSCVCLLLLITVTCIVHLPTFSAKCVRCVRVAYSIAYILPTGTETSAANQNLCMS